MHSHYLEFVNLVMGQDEAKKLTSEVMSLASRLQTQEEESARLEDELRSAAHVAAIDQSDTRLHTHRDGAHSPRLSPELRLAVPSMRTPGNSPGSVHRGQSRLQRNSLSASSNVTSAHFEHGGEYEYDGSASEDGTVRKLRNEIRDQQMAIQRLRTQQGQEMDAADGWARTRAHEHSVLLGQLAKAHSTIEYLRAERSIHGGLETAAGATLEDVANTTPQAQRIKALKKTVSSSTRTAHNATWVTQNILHATLKPAAPSLPLSQFAPPIAPPAALASFSSSTQRQLASASLPSAGSAATPKTSLVGPDKVSHKALQLETLRWQHAAKVEAAECGSLKALNAIAVQKQQEAADQLEVVVHKSATRYEKLRARMEGEIDLARDELIAAETRLAQTSERNETVVHGLESTLRSRVQRLTAEKEDIVQVYEQQLRDASEKHRMSLSDFKKNSAQMLEQAKATAVAELGDLRRVLEETHTIQLHSTREQLFAEQTAELEKFAIEARESAQKSAAEFEAGLEEVHASLHTAQKEKLALTQQAQRLHNELNAQKLELTEMQRSVAKAEEAALEAQRAQNNASAAAMEEVEEYKVTQAKTRQALIAAWEQRLFLSEHNQHVAAEEAMGAAQEQFENERRELQQQLNDYRTDLLRAETSLVRELSPFPRLS